MRASSTVAASCVIFIEMMSWTSAVWAASASAKAFVVQSIGVVASDAMDGMHGTIVEWNALAYIAVRACRVAF